MFQKTVVDKIETHILYSNFIFPPENRAVYGVMKKATVQPNRPQTTIQYGASALHAG